MDTEKLIGTIIISNSIQRDLFRVHIFEESIKFDSYFAYGIAKNDEISKDVLKIDNMWREKLISKTDVFPMMVSLLDKHEGYLSRFYLRNEELHPTGRLKQVNIMNSDSDKTYLYYMHLKNTGKLKKINRKLFEKMMPNDVSEYYIENFEKGKAKFYLYKTLTEIGEDKSCYIMTVSDKIKTGFIC